MKKYLIILVAVIALGSSAQAQLARWGLKAGAGISTIHDDISTESPVFGFGGGAFLDYGFQNAQIAWNTNLYLQFGLNVVRRGGNMQELYKFENDLSIREGYFHTWYAQVPVLLGFKYELPIRQAGHYLNFLIGPAFNVGFYGQYRWRQITPYNPHANVNYDNYSEDDYKARNAFDTIRRLDASILVSVGYHFRHFQCEFIFDYGFVPIRPEDDALRVIERDILGDDKYKVAVPGGNNLTAMLSFGYNFSINEKVRYNKSASAKFK